MRGGWPLVDSCAAHFVPVTVMPLVSFLDPQIAEERLCEKRAQCYRVLLYASHEGVIRGLSYPNGYRRYLEEYSCNEIISRYVHSLVLVETNVMSLIDLQCRALFLNNM